MIKGRQTLGENTIDWKKFKKVNIFKMKILTGCNQAESNNDESIHGDKIRCLLQVVEDKMRSKFE